MTMEPGARIEVDARGGRGLRVALITPFSWVRPSAVNQHVADVARRLAAMGHLPAVLATSDVPGDLRRMRALTRRPEERLLELLGEWGPGVDPDPALLPRPGLGPLSPGDGVPVITLGRSFAFRLNGSVTSIGLPVDVLSRLERVLAGGGFDVVHVHEPIAPSLSFTAIRESRSPVVATFHLTPAALVAYELGVSVLARFYKLLDARIVTSPPAAAVLATKLGGAYRAISPGAVVQGRGEAGAAGLGPGAVGAGSVDGGGAAAAPAAGAPAAAAPTALYVYRGDDSRGLRALMRTLASSFPRQIERVTVAVHRPSAELWAPRPAPRAIRSRVDWVDFDRPEELSAAYREASVTIAPFLGGEWLLQTVAEAIVAGCPVVGPDLPMLESVVADTECAACFDPGLEPSLSASIERALRGDGPAAALGAGSVDHRMEAVAASLVQVYRECLELSAGSGTRDQTQPRPAARARRRRREKGPIIAPGGWIHADLHMHTEHSKDCTSSVEAVVATAREIGLGAIAVTDHDAIAGALEARELAGDDLIVIVAEEVKTLQGEVIGLFIEELIPGGLSFDETLSLIKEQGGLVYVPHPFDRLRTTPSYRLMVDNLHRIDVIETYNARNMLPQFNLTAERFAAKYNVAAGAGSDAHVLPGLGTAMLRMPRFAGPEEFMGALREADIVTRRKSLLYLQSLKLLRTTLDHVLPQS